MHVGREAVAGGVPHTNVHVWCDACRGSDEVDYICHIIYTKYVTCVMMCVCPD